MRHGWEMVVNIACIEIRLELANVGGCVTMCDAKYHTTDGKARNPDALCSYTTS